MLELKKTPEHTIDFSPPSLMMCCLLKILSAENFLSTQKKDLRLLIKNSTRSSSCQPKIRKSPLFSGFLLFFPI